jgi:hypothetical protein
MKYLTFVLGLVLVICISGCSNITGNNEASKEETGLATVIIPLPKNNNRAVGLTDAIAYTDFFEVAFKNVTTSNYYFANASIGDGFIEATIPEGSYDILLFAGDKGYYANYDPLLLATSYAQNITISLLGTNEINMTLATFDISIEVPQKVVIGEEYSINVIIDTKNPLIVYNGPGFFRIEGDEVENNEYAGNENVYTSTKTFTAPLTIGNVPVDYYDYITPFHTQALTTWFVAAAAHPNLGENFKKTIEFVEGASAKINIVWPNE